MPDPDPPADIGARAFARGDDVVFGKRADEDGLVAHEVTHVVQDGRQGRIVEAVRDVAHDDAARGPVQPAQSATATATATSAASTHVAAQVSAIDDEAHAEDVTLHAEVEEAHVEEEKHEEAQHAEEAAHDAAPEAAPDHVVDAAPDADAGAGHTEATE